MMGSNWSYVVASYVLTWAAFAGYVVYVNGRARAATAELRREEPNP